MTRIINLDDLRLAAKRKLPRLVFDFIDGGAEDERTMRSNREAFGKLTLAPRLLAGGAKRDQSITVAGQSFRTPVLLAPTGLSRLAGRQGELAAARAAASRGTVSIVSSTSSMSVDEVARGVDAPQ